MNVETLRAALLWCTVINFAMLLLWAMLALLAPGYVRWHGRLFRLSAEQMDAISYGGMLLYEMGVILFNLVPCIALWIVA
ncbi:MAG TPA: hypothetical protein VFA26_24935 [Gemmataceae bacterium]|nr:hypothetical protein [Gemmataceae bacterium]